MLCFVCDSVGIESIAVTYGCHHLPEVYGLCDECEKAGPCPECVSETELAREQRALAKVEGS